MFLSLRRLLVLTALVALSCGRPQRGSIEAPLPARRPLAIVVEKEISGVVLGDRLKEPFGLAVDFKGYIYVSDAGNNRLVRFKPDFTPDREIGGYGSAGGLLNRPSFLTFDNGLNLMVSEEGNRRVSRYNTRLNFVDELAFYDAHDPLKFGYPSGVAFSDYGETWVADREKGRVAIFDNIGRFNRFLGDFGYSGGQLSSPEEIVKDGDRGFVVCDAANGRLVVYDGFGNHVEEISASEFDYPVAAAVGAGNLWVLDGSTGKVFCLDGKGAIVFRAGPALPGGSISLKGPSDILFLSDDLLLLSDTGNNRLLVCRVLYEGR